MSVNVYKTAALNCGKPASEVEKVFEEIKALYGEFLSTEELLWYQACLRLGVKGLDAPGVVKSASGGGKPTQTFNWKDTDLVKDRDFVKVEGVIIDVQHDEGSEGRKPRIKMRIMDKTGAGNVTFRPTNPDQFDSLKDADPKPGQFFKMDGMVSVWTPPDGGRYVSIVPTRVSDWEVDDKFDPTLYLPSMSGEPLLDRQPCYLKGVVLEAEELSSYTCPAPSDYGNGVCGKNIRRDNLECWNGHTVNQLEDGDEKPVTKATVADGSGFYDLWIDGAHAGLKSRVILAIGQYNANKNNISMRHWEPVDVQPQNTGSVQIKRDQAKEEILQSLKNYKKLPSDWVLNKLKAALDDSETEARTALKELVEAGKVKEQGLEIQVAA